MNYVKLQVSCHPDFSEILMAEIAEAGFDTFIETDDGFEAYAENFDHELLAEIKEKYNHVSPLKFIEDTVEKKNWNEEWEKNVEPVIVDDQILVRAEFHNIDNTFPYEIIITPKMSFGTGHHQTTHLMLKNQMKVDHKNKTVMDAGCGTAILSIMASKLGARSVEAFDIDEWSVINGRENTELNHCTNVFIRQGKIMEMNFKMTFNIILANINRNILLSEMSHYNDYLSAGGHLLLSGFYESDVEDLKKEAAVFGMVEVHRDNRENWACLLLRKK